MTRTHVPVLAGELIDLTGPSEGDRVVDCTFGAGGHARLMADRIGPSGTLVCVDRDPAAEERFEELAAEVACETRFLRMDYAEALALLAEEGFAADLVYFDLGVSSMQIDTRERGFSYSYDAPLDMRMDPGQELDARAVVNTMEERRLAKVFSTYGEERNAQRHRARDRQAPDEGPDRDHGRARGRHRGRLAGRRPAPIRRQFPCQARLPGDPHRGERRARRPGPRAARGLVAPATTAAAWRRSPSTRWRTGASSASWPTARAAASARPTCPSAAAAARPRPS